MIIHKGNWNTWASFVASPAAPDEYNESAVDRMMKKLEEHVIRVKGVRPQFNAVNRVQKIYFKTAEEAQYYNDTEKRYFEEKAQLERDLQEGKEVNGALLHLVLLMKRCMAAEKCRVPHIVEKMMTDVREGYAAVSAVKFKDTIIACVEEMITKHGIPRDQISIIWGGGQTQLTAKQKAKAKLKEKSAQLAELGFNEDEIMETLNLKNVTERVIRELPKEWRLGTQDQAARQAEIDRFQSGKSLYAFFTFRAGGVGLSLHHTDEFIPTELKNKAAANLNYKLKYSGDAPYKKILDFYNAGQIGDAIHLWNNSTVKLAPDEQRDLVTLLRCRRKESGYAVEDDVQYVPVRPRRGTIAPTYSAIELVQGLGRLPRLTSLSPTEQTLLFYGGTVEDDVADVVSQKLRCLSRVVRMREDWQDIVEGKCKAADHLDENPTSESDDNDELLGGEPEEE